MQIEGRDHLVLTVKDVEATLAFYAAVLGSHRGALAPIGGH